MMGFFPLSVFHIFFFIFVVIAATAFAAFISLLNECGDGVDSRVEKGI